MTNSNKVNTFSHTAHCPHIYNQVDYNALQVDWYHNAEYDVINLIFVCNIFLSKTERISKLLFCDACYQTTACWYHSRRINGGDCTAMRSKPISDLNTQGNPSVKIELLSEIFTSTRVDENKVLPYYSGQV